MTNMQSNYLYDIWFSDCAEYTYAEKLLLLKAFCSCKEIYEISESEIELTINTYHKQNRKKRGGLNRSLIEATNKLQAMQCAVIGVLPYSADEYPQIFKETYDPPLLLYYKVNLSCLERRNFAMVGARKASQFGKRIA